MNLTKLVLVIILILNIHTICEYSVIPNENIGSDGKTTENEVTNTTLEPVDYVNPHIGNIGHLLKTTYPGTYLPHGNVWIVPEVNPGFRDRYLADQIYSFPFGSISINVTVGNITIDPKANASFYTTMTLKQLLHITIPFYW